MACRSTLNIFGAQRPTE